MKDIIDSIKNSVEHIKVLDEVFSTFNYPEKEEYLKNQRLIIALNRKFDDYFTDELYYGDDGRQMILNDLFEYIFNGRGYYYMWNPSTPERKNVYISLILRFINQLMIFESISVDHSLRNNLLDNLRKQIGDKDFFLDDDSKKIFEALKSFTGDVHFDTNEKKNIVPEELLRKFSLKNSSSALKEFDKYSDSLLPKLPHGLWRELIVYIQLLRINAGYILPLLLNQRIVSRDSFLKPPDFLIIKENGELIGVEVGGGKETQSSNFSVKMKCQMVTAQNKNIPPRCPICGKWILFCDKVIEDYSNLNDPMLYIYDDLRCAHDCNKFSYKEVLAGKCPYIKYRGKIDKTRKPKQEIKFDSDYHYHYSCIIQTKDKTALEEIKRQKERWEKHLKSKEDVLGNTSRSMTINCLKTNYPYFEGLNKLENYTKESLKCYSKYTKGKNCEICEYKEDCKKLSKLNKIIQSSNMADKEEMIKQIKEIFPK